MTGFVRNALLRGVLVCLIAVAARQGNAQTNRYVSLAGGNIFPYTNWSDAATTVTGAVSACSAGDTVWLAEGTYLLSAPVGIATDINISGTSMLCNAVLDGQNSTRCLEVNSANALVSLLTIQNGYASDYAGGIDLISGTVSNCTIISNQTVAARADGGGVSLGPQGVITHSRVLFNVVTGAEDTVGSGISVWGSGGNYGSIYSTEIRGNKTFGNASSGGGGIFFYQGGYGEDLLICSNYVSGNGGGAMLVSGASLKDCTIIGNQADNRGGGLAFFNAGGNASDCDIIQNSAGAFGGGIDFFQGGYACGTLCISNIAAKGGGAFFTTGGAATNCTFIYNIAPSGGGIFTTNAPASDPGRLTACIVCFNTPANYSFDSAFSQFVEYSLITPTNTYFNGAGNIIDTPSLKTDGSFQAGSTGIDHGVSSGRPRREDPSQDYPADGDFDGSAVFDIGAFEFSNLRDTSGDGMPDGWLYRYYGQVTGIVTNEDTDGDSRTNLGEYEVGSNPLNDIDDGWPWLDGLPQGWRYKYFPSNPLTVTANEDSDLDGMSNAEEAIAGTNPTNPASFFSLLADSDESTTNLIIRWNSAPDRTYHIYSSTNLSPTNTFSKIETIPPEPSFSTMEFRPTQGNFFRISAEY